jgi:hypothetical protein
MITHIPVLTVDGYYIVTYIGNLNPDMKVGNRVSWWIVPGMLNLED